jgi:hypothetical protein
MKKYIALILAISAVVFPASTCEKMDRGDYRAKNDLPGPRVLSEGQLGAEEFSPNTLIIMYDTEVGKVPLSNAVKRYGAGIIYDYSIIPGMAIRIPDGTDIHKAMEYFKKVKGVVSVERDRINHLVEPVKPRLEIM